MRETRAGGGVEGGGGIEGDRQRERGGERESMACKGWHQISPLFTRLSVSQSATRFTVEEAHSTEAAALSARHTVNYLHADVYTIGLF